MIDTTHLHDLLTTFKALTDELDKEFTRTCTGGHVGTNEIGSAVETIIDGVRELERAIGFADEPDA